jgi:2-keto-4-pentenoate hydratase
VSDAVTDALYRLDRGRPADTAVLASHPDGTVDDGLSLQLAVLDRWVGAGSALGGWKVGLTSRGARDSMGPGVRPFGFILAERILRSGTELPFGQGTLRIEPEICLTIGSRLAGDRVGPQDARRAVSAVAPSFEILTPALPRDYARTVRLGYRLNQWGIVVGEQQPPDVDLPRVTVTVWADGAKVDEATADPEIVDDPYTSLARLCHRLAAHGLGLEPGQRVIVGSLTPAVTLSSAHRWEARFAPLGPVEIRLGAPA